MERSWSLLWLIDRQSIISESINYTNSSSGHWTLSFGGVMACVYLLCYVHSLINGFIRWEKVSLRQESYYLAVSVAQLDRQAEDRCYLQLEIRRGVCLHWSYKKKKMRRNCVSRNSGIAIKIRWQCLLFSPSDLESNWLWVFIICLFAYWRQIVFFAVVNDSFRDSEVYEKWNRKSFAWYY